MKHCNYCNVDVNENLQNCPLCGAYLGDKSQDISPEMQEAEKRWSRPTIVINHKIDFMHTKFNKLCITIMAFCLALNIILTPEIWWSAYVIVGLLFTMFCVIKPAIDKTKLRKQIKDDLVWLTIFGVIIELSATKLDFGWISIVYILPWVYVTAIVICDFIIMISKTKVGAFVSTLIFSTIFAVAPQIAFWIAQLTGIAPQMDTMHLFVIFFASLLNLVVVLIVCSKELKDDMERNFNM